MRLTSGSKPVYVSLPSPPLPSTFTHAPQWHAVRFAANGPSASTAAISERLPTDLRAAEQGRYDAVAADNSTLPVPPSVPQASVEALAAGRREGRIAIHGQVWRLKGEGWTAEVIARHLGISRASVFRNLRHEVLRERRAQPA